MNNDDENNNSRIEEDEAMEAASNIMETTTNDSNSSRNSTMEQLDDEQQEGAMEDTVSTDDIAMDQVDEEDDDMVAVVASLPGSEVVDDTMEDKSRSIHNSTVDDVINDNGNNSEVQVADTGTQKMTHRTEKIGITKARSKLSLHDCLALGEVELGLGRCQLHTKEEKKDDDDRKLSVRNNDQLALLEIQRLPYMLRLLSSARPLVSITVFRSSSGPDTDDDLKRDVVVDTLVDRLEDVAAMYSVGEEVDVVSNYLARSLTKNISRLRPLSKHCETIGNSKVINWDTSILAEVGRDPISHSSKRKREVGATEGGSFIPPHESPSTPDSEPDVFDCDQIHASVPRKKRKCSHQKHSLEVAAEDSQEATFVKTLSELVSLVVASLDCSGIESSTQDGDDEPHVSEGKAETSFALKADDSLLSGAESGADEEAGGAMDVSDLGSTLADIMHYAPVLRSEHVASAFCRASLRRTGDFLTWIGANCPSTVPGLLSGCIETYVSARKFGNKLIAETASLGVVALANLSHTECAKVYYKLQSLSVMLDVQLKLAMQLGFVTISCLITQHLTTIFEQKAMSASSARALIKVIPIQRQISGESDDIPEKENEDLGFCGASSGNEPTLYEYFANDQSLFEETLRYYSKEIHVQNGNFEGSRGKWGLGFHALALVLLVPATDTADLSKREHAIHSLSKSFETFLDRKDFAVGGHEHLPEEAHTDKLYGIMTSCIIILSARMGSIEDEAVEDRSYARMIQQAQQMQVTSKYISRLWESIAYAMERKSTRDLFNAAVGPVLSCFVCFTFRSGSYESMFRGLKRLVTLPKLANSEDRGDILIRIAAVRMLVQNSDAFDRSVAALEISKVLRQLLDVEAETKSVSLISSIDVLLFLKEATYFLSKEEGPRIPFISPSQLEITWSKVLSPRQSSSKDDLLDYCLATYVLRLFYCLEYLDSNTSSLFSVDPRSLPLREIMRYAEQCFPEPTKNFVISQLRRLLQKHVSEILLEVRYTRRDSLSVALCDAVGRDVLLEGLHAALIRYAPNTKPYEKGEGSTSEMLFLRSRSCVSDPDLYSTVMRAILSYPHSPAPNFSFSLLCRDPMVVFKCPSYFWSSNSLRRILLTTLRVLIMSNDEIAVQASPFVEVAEELLVARDAIIVRSLFGALHTGEAGNSCICSMTGNFVRWLISRRPGLVALLVKQGLAERDLDWLVEHVPESIRDWEFLLLTLGNSCLTAPERLNVADAISRVAIVFGSDSKEPEAAQMVACAVTELVDSFHFILGPVGVPVSVLLSDDTGEDITKVSRKAALRILKSLNRVRARRHGFRRCSTGLQRLVSVCKVESTSSGVQGTIATRRKQFLKEVYETASKAVGISCQSPN
jgi:hypothetical protein